LSSFILVFSDPLLYVLYGVDRLRPGPVSFRYGSGFAVDQGEPPSFRGAVVGRFKFHRLKITVIG